MNGSGYVRHISPFCSALTLSQKQLCVSPRRFLFPVPRSGGARRDRIDTQRAWSANKALCTLCRFRNEIKFACASPLVHLYKLQLLSSTPSRKYLSF